MKMAILDSQGLTRRGFLAAAAYLPTLAFSQAADSEEFHPAGFWDQPRYVWMRRPATGEEIKSVYFADGALIQEEYAKISWFMRDVQLERRIAAARSAGIVLPASWAPGIGMGLVLLDILYGVNGWLSHFGLSRALILNSGFRHQVTNAITEGAAKNSSHMRGGAGDIVIPGVNASSVGRYGVWLSAGGVGFYPGKSFTHVDDGRQRVWRG